VVAADGQNVVPVQVDEFRFGVGETYDVIVRPTEDRAFTLFAESIDRSGYARATLATRPGMQGEIPAMRPRAVLSMADMGMHHGMDHGTAGPGETNHGAMNHGAMGQGSTGHGSMQHGAPASGATGMDHSAMGHDSMGHGSMGHGAPAESDRVVGWSEAGTPPGARALAYSDLKALLPNRDVRAPTHEIEVRLTGIMERYIWTLNGHKFGHGDPIRVAFGDRVRITYVNTTMMAHPMHLHGMFVELENGSGDRNPRKHVVLVPPGKTVSVLLTADEPGEWPFHCHLLYHMASGMMTRFVVEPRSASL
jgi:CopA family copper-resistance protein